MLSAINNITIDFKNQVLKGNSFKYYPELRVSEYKIPIVKVSCIYFVYCFCIYRLRMFVGNCIEVLFSEYKHG